MQLIELNMSRLNNENVMSDNQRNGNGQGENPAEIGKGK